MKVPPLTPEIGYAATALVDANRPPSHDELTRLFRETKLSKGDPGTQVGTHKIGKLKRMRAVVDYALANDRAAGGRLVNRLIKAVRAVGGFRSDSSTYIGEDVYRNLRDAFRAKGFELDANGELRP